MNWYDGNGVATGRSRRRNTAMLRPFQIPSAALPAPLAPPHRRCGKPTCRCAKGEGHPGWSLTFMVHGKKRVERIPDEWVEQIRPLVEQGREFKDAGAESSAANSQLMALCTPQSNPNRPTHR